MDIQVCGPTLFGSIERPFGFFRARKAAGLYSCADHMRKYVAVSSRFKAASSRIAVFKTHPRTEEYANAS